MSTSVDLGKLAKDIEHAVKTLVQKNNIGREDQVVSCDVVEVTVRLSIATGDKHKQDGDMKAGYILKGGGIVQILLSPK